MAFGNRIGRKRVLLVAAEVFEKHGFVEGSYSLMTDLGGFTTKAIISYYFPSKLELAAAIIRSVYEDRPFIPEGMDGHPTTGIRSIATSCFLVALAMRDDVTVRAAKRLEQEVSFAAHGIDMPPPFVGWLAVIEADLHDAVAAGEVDTDMDPSVEAWTIVASFSGVQQVSGYTASSRDLVDRVHAWLRRTLPALGVADAALLPETRVLAERAWQEHQDRKVGRTA
ncbi:TetR/AcrR family transcriptional regulator [Rathayibacter rathayi]|uniref:TetR/AcrR family transcriptional regulator n=1 Tax=Rathayibacter rathayi TaxID=33887 RepID=UPI000CE7B018|nr:TetR/AcrR family transcriptional regulator [Rathayibacter rathayi]PPG14426.1 hypothetical protein C5C11_05160 [Rathayibacter rathayi]